MVTLILPMVVLFVLQLMSRGNIVWSGHKLHHFKRHDAPVDQEREEGRELFGEDGTADEQLEAGNGWKPNRPDRPPPPARRTGKIPKSNAVISLP